MSKRTEFLKLNKQRLAKETANIIKKQKLGQYPASLRLPVAAQLELTSKCNLFCKHCYNMSSPNSESRMQVKDWKGVVEDIVSNGGIFQCIISGGEPLLLGNSLFEIMTPLANDGTAFILITNGFLVNSNFVKKLKKYDYYWIQVSIDHYIKEEHDSFRGRNGSWEKAVQAALLISGAGFPLRIAHSITPHSLLYLSKFTEFCYKLGASSLVCGEVMLSGRVAHNRDLLMDDSHFEMLYSIVNHLKIKYEGKMDIFLSSPEAIEMEYRQKNINSSVVIRPDGNVRLDCTAPFVIGNIYNEPFSSIWEKYGNSCWKDYRITNYISNLKDKIGRLEHINYFSPDITI